MTATFANIFQIGLEKVLSGVTLFTGLLIVVSTIILERVLGMYASIWDLLGWNFLFIAVPIISLSIYLQWREAKAQKS